MCSIGAKFAVNIEIQENENRYNEYNDTSSTLVE